MTITSLTGRRDWRAAVVLGSGLSGLAEELTSAQPIPYAAIDGLPQATVTGHAGALYAGDVAGTPTLIFAGRLHLYEGHDARTVVAPVRLALDAGCEVVVLTNAAGAIDPALEVGAPCLIRDHLNLTGTNPLIGRNDDDLGPRFPDQSDVYSRQLRELARRVDPGLSEAVYAGLTGPAYETPAEVAMLRTLGAQLVGMSTVNEAIYANWRGAAVLGVSVVSNLAAGISGERLSHEEVTAAGERAAARLRALLKGVLALL